MNHQLIQTNESWYCQICLWNWQTEPLQECPGVPRYSWETKPRYLVSQTSLKKLGFSIPGAYVGAIYQSVGNRWSGDFYKLFDIRQAVSKKGERWEWALNRLAAIQDSRKKKRLMERFSQKLNWQLSDIESNLDEIAELLEDGSYARCFSLPRRSRIERARVKTGLLSTAVKVTKLNLIEIQKLLGKYPQQTDAVLGGLSPEQCPRPWDAVLGGDRHK